MDIVDLRAILPTASLARRVLPKLDQAFIDSLVFCATWTGKQAVYMGSVELNGTDMMAGDHIGWLRTNARGFADQSTEAHAIGGLGEWIVSSRLQHLTTVASVSLVSRDPVTEPDLIVASNLPVPWSASILVDIKTSRAAGGPGVIYDVERNAVKGVPHFLVVGIARDLDNDLHADLYFVNAVHLLRRTGANSPGSSTASLPDLLRDNTWNSGHSRPHTPHLSAPLTEQQARPFAAWLKVPSVPLAFTGVPGQRQQCVSPDWIYKPELRKIVDAAANASRGRPEVTYLFSLACHESHIEAGHRIAWLWAQIAGTGIKQGNIELAIAKWTVMRQTGSSPPEDLQADPGNRLAARHASIVSIGKIDEPDLTIVDGSNPPVCLEIAHLQPGGRLEMPLAGMSDAKRGAHVLAVDRRQLQDRIVMDLYFVPQGALTRSLGAARLQILTGQA